jgi:hypothetical protein
MNMNTGTITITTIITITVAGGIITTITTIIIAGIIIITIIITTTTTITTTGTQIERRTAQLRETCVGRRLTPDRQKSGRSFIGAGVS